ncbi:ECF transporter S component [Gracilibacillus kekensis]|uniref:Energy-coupling factor transport system substrate-specific component n=1 Tax=Gracilibacillus kekensis TaxID=1027249 RepID=A0A1M7PS70_9BACI|nr:ECF transporter S component [Gracilibacillus kekensis]SHN20109.1 energy-coupling factor transport system substrate-specific component [Gracilibacillus kekensis]
MNTYKLTLISLLAALCVIGRISFQFLPNVQPVTTIIIIASAMLGVLPGIFIAIISTYLTNLFLGMGIWTIWQMIAWTVIAMLSGLLGKYEKSNKMIAFLLFSILAAYIYGLVVNIGSFTYAGSFLAYYLAGIPFDTMHAIGNGAFMLILYPILVRLFQHQNG